MFPQRFIKRISTQDYIDTGELLKSLQQASPSSIRINLSKWTKRPLHSEPVPWCSSGFYLETRPSFTLDPLFHSGCYYPQEASGMFIEQVFRQIVNTEGNIRVLDLCGAPGGKSTHLSSLIGTGGLLVSNEVIRSRASILAENIAKWGAGNTIVSQNDPSVFTGLQGFFDVILVDAPCSGEGMFRDPVAINEWSEENTFHCSERQKRILADVWPALNENGILIFITCTFNPGENEENIKWLVSSHQAESLELDLSDFSGITKIDFQGINGYGFYPGRIKGEGLFVSVIRKISNSGKIMQGKRRGKIAGPEKSDIEIASTLTSFNPKSIIRYGDEIHRHAGKPHEFQFLRQKLKIISPGTKICTLKKNGYVPAHELALSTGIRNDFFLKAELDHGQAIAYLRRDNIAFGNIPKGWFIVSYKSINLGFCNNIGNRVNNYYPVDLRIRMSIPKEGPKNVILWDG
jgi:16S rRNA C967 or C1407 C5-methylase (RsmB/RsmF family)/NOL1/NOP2/fmu family ribosome biogenesis protein